MTSDNHALGQFSSRSPRASLSKERAYREHGQFYSWMLTWKLNIAFVAVLVLYLTKDLMFNKANGKSIYHAFSMTSYFTGVIGAMIADSWLGKYKWVLQIYNTLGVISWMQASRADILLVRHVISPCQRTFNDFFLPRGESSLSTFRQKFLTVRDHSTGIPLTTWGRCKTCTSLRVLWFLFP